MFRYVPSSPAFPRIFILKICWILSKAFSAYAEMIIWFSSSLHPLMYFLPFIALCMLNITKSLGQCPLGHGGYYFWCMSVFALYVSRNWLPSSLFMPVDQDVALSNCSSSRMWHSAAIPAPWMHSCSCHTPTMMIMDPLFETAS